MAGTVEHTGATTVHHIDVMADTESGRLSPAFTTVMVYPGEGNFPFIAKELLKVADHPSQVRSVSHPRAGFEVPADVFDRFVAAQPDEEQETSTAEPPAQEEPRKRRPGRARKEPLLSPEELAAAVAAGTPDPEPEAQPKVDDASKEE